MVCMCITSDLFSTGVGEFDLGVRMFWSVELRLLCPSTERL